MKLASQLQLRFQINNTHDTYEKRKKRRKPLTITDNPHRMSSFLWVRVEIYREINGYSRKKNTTKAVCMSFKCFLIPLNT